MKKIMKALVYHGPGKKSWEEKPKPKIQQSTDAVVRITKTTICGTDLHILKGDVPEVTDGRILGHEGVGVRLAVRGQVARRRARPRLADRGRGEQHAPATIGAPAHRRDVVDQRLQLRAPLPDHASLRS